MAQNTKSVSLVHASSQYANIVTNVTNGFSKLTVMGWMNPTSLVANYCMASLWPDGSNTQWIFRINSASGDLVVFIANATNDPGNNFGVTPTGVVATSVWHHVAFVFDGTQTGNANRLKIYIDGVLQSLTFTGTIPSVISSPSIAPELRMGARDASTDFFDGLLNNWRIEQDALTQQQIVFYSLNDLLLSTTRALYLFNNNLNDSSANALNLTGHGTPTFSNTVPYAWFYYGQSWALFTNISQPLNTVPYDPNFLGGVVNAGTLRNYFNPAQLAPLHNKLISQPFFTPYDVNGLVFPPNFATYYKPLGWYKIKKASSIWT